MSDYDAKRTVKSLATMLGWMNVPPRETLEMSVSLLKKNEQRLRKLLKLADKALEEWSCSCHDGQCPACDLVVAYRQAKEGK